MLKFNHFFLIFSLNIFFVQSLFADDLFNKSKPINNELENIEDFLSEKSSISNSEKQEIESDKLQIGGYISSELDYYSLNNKNNISFPSTLSLYLDSKLKNDIRGYSLIRIIFDPSQDSTTVSPITGQQQDKYTFSLDELKIMFNIKKSAFVTAGKQKIKWGTAKFWNPSDILNQTKREMFKTTDDREGVSLLKVNIPVSDSNFYFIGDFDNTNEAQNTGIAARIELPLAASELSATFFSQGHKKNVYALDYSWSLFDFDFYHEFSYTKAIESNSLYTKNSSFKASNGINYTIKYNENNSFSLGLEYFYNSVGLSAVNDYMNIFLSKQYIPYYLSKHYIMENIYFIEPFNVRYINFGLYNMSNLSDHSNMLRFSFDGTFLHDLNFSTGAGLHYGNPNGELCIMNQKVDAFIMLKVVL